MALDLGAKSRYDLLIIPNHNSHHEKPRGTTIQSVSRAARLLLLVAQRPDGTTASEAAAAMSLAVSTTYHLLKTLALEGLLSKDSSRRFVLGPRAAVLADAVARQTRVPDYLGEPLARLAQGTGETAYLAAWRNEAITVLKSVAGPTAVRVAEVERGSYRHAHARATGKLLLAFAPVDARDAYLVAHPLVRVTPNTVVDRKAFDEELERIRTDGYAEDHEEFVEGVACLSVPIRVDGVVIAAYTVSAPAARFAQTRDELLAAALRAADAATHAAADTELEENVDRVSTTDADASSDAPLEEQRGHRAGDCAVELRGQPLGRPRSGVEAHNGPDMAVISSEEERTWSS